MSSVFIETNQRTVMAGVVTWVVACYCHAWNIFQFVRSEPNHVSQNLHCPSVFALTAEQSRPADATEVIFQYYSEIMQHNQQRVIHQYASSDLSLPQKHEILKVCVSTNTVCIKSSNNLVYIIFGLPQNLEITQHSQGSPVIYSVLRIHN